MQGLVVLQYRGQDLYMLGFRVFSLHVVCTCIETTGYRGEICRYLSPPTLKMRPPPTILFMRTISTRSTPCTGGCKPPFSMMSKDIWLGYRIMLLMACTHHAGSQQELGLSTQHSKYGVEKGDCPA